MRLRINPELRGGIGPRLPMGTLAEESTSTGAGKHRAGAMRFKRPKA